MITYPRPECSHSPTKAHYWICTNRHKWECKFCHRTVLFPRNWDAAKSLDADMDKLGLDAGYAKWLKDYKLEAAAESIQRRGTGNTKRGRRRSKTR